MDLQKSIVNSKYISNGLGFIKIKISNLFIFVKKYKLPLTFILANFILLILAHWPWIKETSWSWRPAQTLLTTFWFKKKEYLFPKGESFRMSDEILEDILFSTSTPVMKQ
jgi:hypothetical protein